MIKKVLIGLLLLSGSLFAGEFPPLTAETIANECEEAIVSEEWEKVLLQRSFDYTYFTVGIPQIIPSLGMGKRWVSYGNALDVSVEASTIIVYNRLQSNIKYMRYLDFNWYAGIGASCGFEYKAREWNTFWTPVICIGKESGNKVHEFDISVYNYNGHNFPGITYKMCFKY